MMGINMVANELTTHAVFHSGYWKLARYEGGKWICTTTGLPICDGDCDWVTVTRLMHPDTMGLCYDDV